MHVPKWLKPVVYCQIISLPTKLRCFSAFGYTLSIGTRKKSVAEIPWIAGASVTLAVGSTYSWISMLDVKWFENLCASPACQHCHTPRFPHLAAIQSLPSQRPPAINHQEGSSGAFSMRRCGYIQNLDKLIACCWCFVTIHYKVKPFNFKWCWCQTPDPQSRPAIAARQCWSLEYICGSWLSQNSTDLCFTSKKHKFWALHAQTYYTYSPNKLEDKMSSMWTL